MLSVEQAQNWDMWHKCFGHISYVGLKELHNKGLIEGFNVNTESQMTDCTTCVQGKLTVRPFLGHQEPCTKKGQITHIDLWGKYGKYDVMSIRGNQYYLLLVDDATRYVTLKFIKLKSDAAKDIQGYLTYLQIRGNPTQAIKIDRGTEFLNLPMREWCNIRGIEIQTTAPYSPSQNGVAERMNRTLVELARAMLTATQLPEFLWEPAITHTAYVRNRSYTRSIPSRTPYQGWNTNKPNVSHLREFGTPVHILLQGQQTQCKILPKTHQHFYVGNEDNSNSIIYYSKETRRLNVSRNYYFINDNYPDVHINDPAREGEWPREATCAGPNASEINNQDINAQNRKETPTQIPTIDKGSNEIKLPQKHTHDIIEPTDKDVPRKTRGIKRDY